MENRTEWGRKLRTRKADNGHSPVRYGTLRDLFGGFVKKSYVECECGQVSSGQGRDGGLRSHEKHRDREAVKAHRDRQQ